MAAADPPAILQPGHILLRRYKVTRLAGQGSCSQVYEVWDSVEETKCAFKLLVSPMSTGGMAYPLSADDARRAINMMEQGTKGGPFAQECMAAQKLGTRSSTSVRAQGLPFISELGVAKVELPGPSANPFFCYCITDLLGPDLCDAFIDGHEHLTVAQFVALGSSMLHTLAHVHAHGLVHRDIKPENFCLQPPAEADAPVLPCPTYLTDWDFAIPYDDGANPSACSSSFYGTPDYASVRALRGYTQTPRDDLESLGYTLLVLATRSLPWGYLASDHGVPFRREIRRQHHAYQQQQEALRQQRQQQHQRAADEGGDGGAASGAPSSSVVGEVLLQPPVLVAGRGNLWSEDELMHMARVKENMLSQAMQQGSLPSYMACFLKTVRSLGPHDPIDYSQLETLIRRAEAPLVQKHVGLEVWHSTSSALLHISGGAAGAARAVEEEPGGAARDGPAGVPGLHPAPALNVVRAGKRQRVEDGHACAFLLELGTQPEE